MKRMIVTAVLAAMLLVGLVAAPASAVPRFGQRYTNAHGYIVWVRNDGLWSRVHCEWNAGRHWTLNWRLSPREYSWTTSDAGNWGDQRPQDLECTYRRI
jgi:hypothetical protein